MTLLKSGPIDYSAGALAILQENLVDSRRLIRRHLDGDWGEHGTYHAPLQDRASQVLSSGQTERNRLAVDQNQGAVKSEFRVGQTRIWILTQDLGTPFLRTIVTLPSEL